MRDSRARRRRHLAPRDCGSGVTARAPLHCGPFFGNRLTMPAVRTYNVPLTRTGGHSGCVERPVHHGPFTGRRGPQLDQRPRDPQELAADVHPHLRRGQAGHRIPRAYAEAAVRRAPEPGPPDDRSHDGRVSCSAKREMSNGSQKGSRELGAVPSSHLKGPLPAARSRLVPQHLPQHAAIEALRGGQAKERGERRRDVYGADRASARPAPASLLL